MPSPQDIDALLIGALYGELSPSERAQLDAHLAESPEARAAMAKLTETRSLVQSTRILTPLEPPQAISARLLQEAAARAPRTAPKVARDPERPGLLARLFGGLVHHPAMSAAATLVLLVGVVGIAKLSSQSKQAQPTASATMHDDAPDDDVVAGAAPAAPAAADGYRAQLDSGAAFGQGEADQKDALRAVAKEQAEKAGAVGRGSGVLEINPTQRRDVLEPAPDPTASYDDLKLEATGKAANEGEQREVPTETKKKTGTRSVDEEQVAQGFELDSTVRTPPTTGNAPGGGAAAPSPQVADRPADAPAKPRATQPTTTNTTTAVATNDGSRNGNAPKPNAPAPVVVVTTPPNAVPPPPPPPPSKTEAPKGGKPDSNAGNVATSDDSWAAARLEDMRQLVRDGKCDAATKVGTEIRNRNPAYYDRVVATDRQVRACKAAMDAQERRDKDMRKAPAPTTNNGSKEAM